MSFRIWLEIKQSEIEHHDLEDKIEQGSKGKFDGWAFNNIFKTAQRIVIPLGKGGAPPMNPKMVTDKLEKEGFKTDLKAGIVSQTVNTKKGQQTRNMKIGRALKMLSKKGDFWNRALQWWSMMQDKTKKMGDPTGVSIIVSRSPIDIIRMSDHKEWRSCHAPPGKPGHISGYWPCATQEARTGGAISYVVRNKDLANLEDLQAADIFKDSDRDVDGIEPLERLRLRRLTINEGDKNYTKYDDPSTYKEDQYDILIPELSTYGVRHVDFAKTVTAWARNAQADIIKKKPKFSDAVLRGGSYEDNRAAQLWNNFFQTSEASGSIRKADEDEEKQHGGESAESMEDQAAEQLNAHQENWKHVDCSYEIEDHGDGPFIWYRGSVFFNFDEDDFIKVPEEDDLERSSYGKGEHKLGDKLRELDIWTVESIGVQTYNKAVTIYYDIYDEGDGNYGDGPMDLFEHWLDYLDAIEDDYAKHYTAVREIFVDMGYLRDWRKGWNFKHFKIERDDGRRGSKLVRNIWITSVPMWIGDLKGVERQNVNIGWKGQLEFPNHNSISANVFTIFPQFNKGGANIKLSAETWPDGKGIIQKPSKVYINLSSEVLPENKKLLLNFNHIDKLWDKYQQRASRWWELVKPMLMDQKGGGFANRTNIGPFPRRIRPTASQKEFGFREWMQLDLLVEEFNINVDGAEITYEIMNGIPVIIGFDRLNWMKKGVIEKAVEAVKRHANAAVVKTSRGIKQHWQHAGYKGH